MRLGALREASKHPPFNTVATGPTPAAWNADAPISNGLIAVAV
jgi:hypothetical protein